MNTYLEENVVLDLGGALGRAPTSGHGSPQKLLDHILSVTRDVDGKNEFSVEDSLLRLGLAAVRVEGGPTGQKVVGKDSEGPPVGRLGVARALGDDFGGHVLN